MRSKWTWLGLVLVIVVGIAVCAYIPGCGSQETTVDTTTDVEASGEATSAAEGGSAAVDSEISASIEGSTVTVTPSEPATNMWDFLIDVTHNWFVWITTWAIIIAKALPNESKTFGLVKKG